MKTLLPGLVTTVALRDRARRIYERNCMRWMRGEVEWPLRIPLGSLREMTVASDPSTVRVWISEWQAIRLPLGVSLKWMERRWRSIGVQNVPSHAIFETARSIALFAGNAQHWDCLVDRHAQLTSAGVSPDAALAVARDVSKYTIAEFESLVAVIRWALLADRKETIYLRQLPIEGIDTKWIEGHSKVVEVLLRSALPNAASHDDLYSLLNIRKPPTRLRIRVLDPNLRKTVGGLSDIEAPIREIAAIDWAPHRALIVENIQAGLMLPDMHGTIVILGLGYAVDVLELLPWVRHAADRVYWGDIDTHGLACLASAREYVESHRSVLMDSATLLANRALWVEESSQKAIDPTASLTASERLLYEGLVNQDWGKNVRLEQERLPMKQVDGAFVHFA